MKRLYIFCTLLAASCSLQAMELSEKQNWSWATCNYLATAHPDNITIKNCATEQEKEFYNTPEIKLKIKKIIVNSIKALSHDDTKKTDIKISIDARRLSSLPSRQQKEKVEESYSAADAATLAGLKLLLKTPAENIEFINLPDILKPKVTTTQQKEALKQALLSVGNAVTPIFDGGQGNTVVQKLQVEWSDLQQLPTCSMREVKPSEQITTLKSLPLENLSVIGAPGRITNYFKDNFNHKQELKNTLLSLHEAITYAIDETDNSAYVTVNWAKIVQPKPTLAQRLVQPAKYVLCGASFALLGYLFAQYNMND